MRIQMKISLMVSMVLYFISTACADQGKAVYYDPPYSRSACYQNQDRGSMVTGVSDALWDGGKACGKRYRVRCIAAANTAPHPCHDGASVEVEVVDYCRQPCIGILNLSKDAFAVIADTTAGKVQVEYTTSACNGYKNDGVMIAAASYAIWNNGAVCNKFFIVKCTGATNQGVPHPCSDGSVLVKIVDLCPPGCQGTIDLSQEAFSAIADPDAGRIKIEFNRA